MELQSVGDGNSPWPVMSNGVHLFAFDVNDEIMSWDKSNPYAFTYRVIKTKVPIFRGVTGAIEIFDGPTPSESVFTFVGCFDNVVPAGITKIILRYFVMGPACKRAATEYAQGLWDGRSAPV